MIEELCHDSVIKQIFRPAGGLFRLPGMDSENEENRGLQLVFEVELKPFYGVEPIEFRSVAQATINLCRLFLPFQPRKLCSASTIRAGCSFIMA